MSVDDKGRIVIPKIVRDELTDKYEGRLVMGQTFQARCISIYPKPEFERIRTELKSRQDGSPRFQRLWRVKISTGRICDMQANGRVLIPKELRVRNEIVGNAVLIDADPNFELWSETEWQKHLDEFMNDSDEDYLSYLQKTTT